MASPPERLWVKICGVRTLSEALHAAQAGASALGLNLHPPSPRSIGLPEAAALAQALRERLPDPPVLVLVLVSPTEAQLERAWRTIRPDQVQVHGDDSAARSLDLPRLPVFRGSAQALDLLRAQAPPRFLLDAYVPGQDGGTGQRVDLDLARAAAALGQLVLAGGLRPDNVADIVAAVRPWGVDVASGVERHPGEKDPDAVTRFIAQARAAG